MALIEGAFDADGAYGPTILLACVSLDGVRLLRSIFDDLAQAPAGTTVRLHGQAGVSLPASIPELHLGVVDRPPRRRLVRSANGGFRWACTPPEWDEHGLWLEPFLEGRPGHQYLTVERVDDALVEVSYGEGQLGHSPEDPQM